MNGDFKRNPLCTERKYIIIPKDAQYNPKLNKITVHYRMPMQHMFILNGVNARDFGYQYIYARQYENIDFKSENNITKNVYRLEDYIHTGGSCGISGGCNNGSPRQTYLDFDTRENTVGKISLKLWRKKPQSSSDTADINYDIIITTSKN